MISKVEAGKKVLEDLIKVPGVEAAVLSTFDGLPLTSTLSSMELEEKIAALTAVLTEVASRTLRELNKGESDWTITYSKDGSGILLTDIKSVGYLSIVFSKNTRLGIVLHEARIAKRKLSQIFSSES